MDIAKALRELYSEKKRLDATIAVLESRLRSSKSVSKPAKGRRGRKSMSAEERREVSKRMTQYWEARRAQHGAGAPSAPTPQEDHQASSTAAS
jgi:hypothetical protein